MASEDLSGVLDLSKPDSGAKEGSITAAESNQQQSASVLDLSFPPKQPALAPQPVLDLSVPCPPKPALASQPCPPKQPALAPQPKPCPPKQPALAPQPLLCPPKQPAAQPQNKTSKLNRKILELQEKLAVVQQKQSEQALTLESAHEESPDPQNEECDEYVDTLPTDPVTPLVESSKAGTEEPKVLEPVIIKVNKPEEETDSVKSVGGDMVSDVPKSSANTEKVTSETETTNGTTTEPSKTMGYTVEEKLSDETRTTSVDEDKTSARDKNNENILIKDTESNTNEDEKNVDKVENTVREEIAETLKNTDQSGVVDSENKNSKQGEEEIEAKGIESVKVKQSMNGEKSSPITTALSIDTTSDHDLSVEMENPIIEIDILHTSRPPSSLSSKSSENPTIEVDMEDVRCEDASLVKGVVMMDVNEDSMDMVSSQPTGSASESASVCEDSNMSAVSTQEETPKVKVRKTPARKRGPDLTLTQLTGGNHQDGITAEHLCEYKWPQEGSRGEWYMIQEQVSEFLGVKSFKRKYQDLVRRNIEPAERVYLRDKGVVTEMQADLGLTIVKADLIHDLMSKDYIDKYKEYITVLRERKKQANILRNKELQAQKADLNTLASLRERAIKNAVSFNAMLNRDRREERRAYFDVHTFEVQFPYDKKKILPPERTKVGPYPVALIPGQFQNYYKKYSPQEMNYLPLNTAVYSSPRKQSDMYADPIPGSDGEQSDDEVSSESSEASSLVNSDGESVEIGSDMFEEDDEENEENAEMDGKSKEEKKEEINRKVKEILDKLNYKESRKRKRGRPPMTEAMKKAKLEAKLELKLAQKLAARQAASEGGAAVGGAPMGGVSGGESSGPGSGTATPTPGGLGANGGGPLGKGRTPRRQAKKPAVKKTTVRRGSKDVPVCNICNGTDELNSTQQAEAMVQCSECNRYGHPSCLELTTEMISIIKTYPWQCMECKTCVKCKDAQHEDKMLFCDHCDRGYHTFCVGLQTIPNGRWECASCLPQGVMLDPLTDLPMTLGARFTPVLDTSALPPSQPAVPPMLAGPSPLLLPAASTLGTPQGPTEILSPMAPQLPAIPTPVALIGPGSLSSMQTAVPMGVIPTPYPVTMPAPPAIPVPQMNGIPNPSQQPRPEMPAVLPAAITVPSGLPMPNAATLLPGIPPQQAAPRIALPSNTPQEPAPAVQLPTIPAPMEQ